MKANKVFTKIKCWYRADVLNRVMLIAGITAFFVVAISGFDKSGALMYLGIGALAVTVGASFLRTYKAFKAFNLKVKEVEFRHRVRESEMYGEVTSECYTAEDKKLIKQKKKNYYFAIGFHVILLVILIAFVVQGKV